VVQETAAGGRRGESLTAGAKSSSTKPASRSTQSSCVAALPRPERGSAGLASALCISPSALCISFRTMYFLPRSVLCKHMTE
jgi:hypothetical protein